MRFHRRGNFRRQRENLGRSRVLLRDSWVKDTFNRYLRQHGNQGGHRELGPQGELSFLQGFQRPVCRYYRRTGCNFHLGI